MSRDSLYGRHFYVEGEPVTVVGERYNIVFFVEGHHEMGSMASEDFRAAAEDACAGCGMLPLPGTTNDGHKISCSYGPRNQSKITGPLSMLQEFAPPNE